MSDKKIDFLAERDKRRGGVNGSGGESGGVPDYMKILYGENASEHMTATDETDYENFFYEDGTAGEEEPELPESVPVQRKKSGGLYGGIQETDFETDEDGFVTEDVQQRRKKDGKQQSREERRRKSNEKLEAVINEPMVVPSMSEEKRKKGACRNIAAAVIAAVLMIAFAVVAVVGAKKNAGYTLAYITEGEIVNQGSGEVSFVRQGEILYAKNTGTFVPNVNEGDKVSAGYTLGYVADEDSVNDVVRLRNLDKVILSMQDTVGVTDSVDSTELETAEDNIDNYIKDLSDMSYNGRLTNCNDLLVQLTAMLNYRNELIINTESSNSSVSELQKEREALADSLESRMKPVVAEGAGIVTFCMSGCEDSENTVFTAFKDNASYAVDASSIKTETKYTANTEVQNGQAIARVVTSQEYYIIVTSDVDYSASLGKSVTVSANNGKFCAKGSILSFSVNTDGRYNMIIRTNKGLRASLEGAAGVTFEISRSSGYCVPLSALTDWDKPGKTARLAVVKAGMVRFVYVSVKDYDDEFAIIENSYYSSTDVYYGEEETDSEIEPVFEANDWYVVNADGVTEGQVIT